MPVVVPKARRIICSDDEQYQIPINILSDKPLSMHDELLIQEMTRYRPRTKIKEGDVLYLMAVPPWLWHQRDEVPRWWKVRFVASYWAYHIMSVATKVGGGVTVDHARQLLRGAANHVRGNARLPMVFAVPVPHGENANSAVWLPVELLKRTTLYEPNQHWRHIVEEFKTAYRGYELRPDIAFHFDLEPDDYAKGQNLGRPLRAEEDLVDDMCAQGFETSLHVPYKKHEADKLRAIEEDHDTFTVED